MSAKDFLLEIGCEELPAKNLYSLINQVSDKISQEMKSANIHFGEIKYFATPRRLAILIKKLASQQPDKTIEKKGPALNAPEKALEGFLTANRISKDNLIQKENYFYYCYEEKGKNTEDLLPELINTALSKVTNIKTMRWGNHSVLFPRPVHWVLMLYGKNKINTEILGIKTIDYTYGHRFHHPQKINILDAADYEEVLFEEGFVRSDFEKRQKTIRQEITRKAKVIIDENLLEEVTGLVEWPVILMGEFPKEFLSIPKEVIITSLQHHQKCFAVYDAQDNLLPQFITVSNIQSENPQEVILGNERVIRARLSDAKFFYEQDNKILLGLYLKQLEQVVFHKKLGSYADKVKRIVKLSEEIAERIHADKEKTRRAAILCKADLMTSMVGEFPELQGIMGEYYARAQGEPEDVCKAISEHYLPKFSGDKLPKTAIGCVIALADRFDSLNSIFSINEIPTGEKDPFGLRRAALGIIRIIIEKELVYMDLDDFCDSDAVKNFILERLPAIYPEKDALQAVLAVDQDNLVVMHKRMLALQAFRQLPEALALSEANKRVKNILKKNNVTNVKIDPKLFEYPAEKVLYEKIKAYKQNESFEKSLEALAGFKEPIDQFFTDVMVEVDDEKIKLNRLALLQQLRNLFLNIADISLLQLQ